MKIYIYTLKDPVNNIVAYIGETVSPDAREKAHQSDAKHPVNYYPLLNFPVTTTTDNWKQWLGYMGIVPVMTIIDELIGTKRQGRALERKHIVEYTQRGIRLCNDYKPTKKLPCPYATIWKTVWHRYQSLIAPTITAEQRFPELVTMENELIQKIRYLDAIRNRLRVVSQARKRELWSLANKAELADREQANLQINAMFATERMKAKTIPLLPSPQEKAS